MIIQNTTLQNLSKLGRLATERRIPSHHVDGQQVVTFLRSLDQISAPIHNVLFSIGIELLPESKNPEITTFLDEYSVDIIELPLVPQGTQDLLGSAYQYLTTKAQSLRKGAFYTGRAQALDLVSDLEFNDGQTILDPSCGSGSLLFASEASSDQIVGVDNDPLAVMIAKFNYFRKFPDADAPRIYCSNFFSWCLESTSTFDYVVGNPPFGGEVDGSLISSFYIRSGESFSHFLEAGYNMLAPGGMLRFLVPEALLNVTRHTDVRDFLLEASNLRTVKKYSKSFSGVMSTIYSVELDRGQNTDVTFIEDESHTVVPKSFLRSIPNRVMTPWNDDDLAIVRKVREQGVFDLKESTFGLGVVTGDNRSKLLSEMVSGAEPIFTGRQVVPYRLLPATNYLVFDRDQLQQVAPDAIYRAPQKLVYKVICKNLRFALDSSQALTTNSANILIPNLPGYSIRSVMALLNSDLYSFLHAKLFGGVNKVAKSSLQGLPFPLLSEEQDSFLSALVEEALVEGEDEEMQTYIHTTMFGLEAREIEYVRSFVSGK